MKCKLQRLDKIRSLNIVQNSHSQILQINNQLHGQRLISKIQIETFKITIAWVTGYQLYLRSNHKNSTKCHMVNRLKLDMDFNQYQTNRSLRTIYVQYISNAITTGLIKHSQQCLMQKTCVSTTKRPETNIYINGIIAT